FGAKLVGSHVYAAKMHDKRFKQMEAGLPEEYHDENELERQRQIHDSLITRGLQIITDSYLDIVDKKTAEANIPVERRSLEGSHFSFGGLKTALALGKALNKPVEAVSAFDPYFHYAAFHSISGVLNEEAGKVFRFKEQEKLHEEIIDSGLAKIYQAHLDIGRE